MLFRRHPSSWSHGTVSYFIYRYLLIFQAVVNQIEVTMENVHVMKRKKLALDNKVKKLRILHNRKFRYRADLVHLATGNGSHLGDSENHSELGDDKARGSHGQKRVLTKNKHKHGEKESFRKQPAKYKIYFLG